MTPTLHWKRGRLTSGPHILRGILLGEGFGVGALPSITEGCRNSPGYCRGAPSYLLPSTGERSFHVGFEVHRGGAVGEAAVHLSTLDLTCKEEMTTWIAKHPGAVRRVWGFKGREKHKVCRKPCSLSLQGKPLPSAFADATKAASLLLITSPGSGGSSCMVLRFGPQCSSTLWFGRKRGALSPLPKNRPLDAENQELPGEILAKWQAGNTLNF